MIAAGNLDALKGMHPALRSRIKGYGYEVYMSDTIEDNVENRQKLVRFVAQEVVGTGRSRTLTAAPLKRSSVRQGAGLAGKDILR